MYNTILPVSDAAVNSALVDDRATIALYFVLYAVTPMLVIPVTDCWCDLSLCQSEST